MHPQGSVLGRGTTMDFRGVCGGSSDARPKVAAQTRSNQMGAHAWGLSSVDCLCVTHWKRNQDGFPKAPAHGNNEP